jgi:signal transduction histidine kinase
MKSAERELPSATEAGPRPGVGAHERGDAVDAYVGGRDRSRRRTVADPIVQDTLIATLLTAVSLVGLLEDLELDLPADGKEARHRTVDTLGFVLALLQTVPLVWRRRAPVAVLAVCTSAMFLYFTLGYPPSFASLGVLLALCTVATYRTRRISIPAALASGGAVLSILVVSTEPMAIDTVLAGCVVVGAVWFIGDGLRVKRGQVVLLQHRAVRLEREREEAALRAVIHERRVIARELHDVVANNVSVIVAQSAAAQRVFDVDPEEGRSALNSIEGSGRDALVEMRRLLGLLRTDDARDPQRGLDDIEALLGQVRETGLPVELIVQGQPRALPAALELSAYRIVQEALTNVMEHAGPARASVTIRYGASSLELTIADDGQGSVARGNAQTGSTTYGHLGMRERVGIFRGQLRVGPLRGGGYEVVASLPLDTDAT